MILIFEAIRSLHLQTMGTEHQLQPFALQNVVIMDSDEERVQGGLKKTLNEETIDIDEDL